MPKRKPIAAAVPDLESTTVSWAVRIESLSKIVLALAGASYVLRILVVNLYYGKHGYFSLSLFRISYAISGFWLIAFLITAYFLWETWFENLATVFRNKEEQVVRILAGIGILVGPLFIWGFGTGLAAILHIHGQWEWLGISFLAFISLSNSRKEVGNFIVARLKQKVRVGSAFELLFTLLLLIAYLAGFSRTLFPLIPGNIGGGMPHEIQLVVPSEDSFALRKLGIHFADEQSDSSRQLPQHVRYSISTTINVLTFTEDEIVILRPLLTKANQLLFARVQ